MDLLTIGVTDMMDGQWNYCCRCDKIDAMVPKGERSWECVYCGLRIYAQHIEKDVFLSDQVLSQAEVGRHIMYCQKLADKKAERIRATADSLEPKQVETSQLPRRFRFVMLLCRILRIPITQYQGRFTDENNT